MTPLGVHQSQNTSYYLTVMLRKQESVRNLFLQAAQRGAIFTVLWIPIVFFKGNLMENNRSNKSDQKSRSAALRRTAVARAVSMHISHAIAVGVTVGAAMAFAPMAYAQSTTGSIAGSAPAGTTVVVTSTTGVSRTLTADQTGRYASPQLPAGDYTVEAKGLGKQQVLVTIGGSVDASFGTALQAVTVVGSAASSRIDVTNVDTRTVFTATDLQKIAVGASVNQVALLAPSVINSTNYNKSTANAAGTDVGQPNIGSFGGAAASENAYYINGFPVTNPLTSIGATGLAFNSIAQQQVLTGGYAAEFGRSTGGVISIVTKRGTNELHGGAYSIWNPSWGKANTKDINYPDTGNWSQANHYAAYNTRPEVWTDNQLYSYKAQNTASSVNNGLYLGGPLIEDRLFFFVNAEQTKANSEGSRILGNLQGLTTAGASAISATNRAQAWGVYEDVLPRWTAKVDWNLTPNNILEFTGVQDNKKSQYAYYGFDYGKLQRDDVKFNGDHTTEEQSRLYIAKYTGYITDQLTLSALYGRQQLNHIPDPLGGYDPTKTYASIGPSVVPAAFAGISNQQPYSTITDAGQDKTTGWRLDVAYKLDTHELRAGLDNFTANSTIGDRLSGPGYNWIYNRTTVPTSAVDASHGVGTPASAGASGIDGYYVDQYFTAHGGTVSTEQKAWYLEDRWNVNKNLLLSLGVRNDTFTNYNGDNKAYLVQSNNLAPRLGAVWDVRGNSTLKVFGNLGRYFLAVPNNVAIRGANASLSTDKYYTYDSIAADGTPVGLHPIAITDVGYTCKTGTPGAGGVSSNLECGNSPDPRTVAAVDLKPHYQDELIVGFEQAFNKNLSAGAKFTYRKLKSAIDDICPTGCFIFNPGIANTFWEDDGTGKLVQHTYTNADLGGFPELKRLYTAIDLFAEYKDSKWYGKLNYTYSRNNGNAEGQLNSSSDTGSGGQSDVSVTQDWDLPELMMRADGKLPNNRTHQIKAFGYYQATNEWRLGGSAIVQSGRPSSCTSYYPYAKAGIYNGAYYYWCGVPGAQTAVNNSTVVPNAGYVETSRGDMGESPWTKTFNVSVAYMPERVKGLTLQADVFNLFNEQVPTAYYERSASSRTTVNARYQQVLYNTDPRSLRLTARYDF